MPTFEPPVVYDVPAVLGPVPPFPRGTPQERLFSHYRSRPRGRTVLLLKSGPCVTVDWPTQEVPGSPELGDVFTENGIGGYLYTDIARVFTGGHVYEITDAEAALLTTCGFGSGIYPTPTPPARRLTWGFLSSMNWDDFTDDFGTWG